MTAVTHTARGVRRHSGLFRSVWTRASATGLVVAAVTASLLGAGGAVVQADPAVAATDEALTSSAVTLTNKDDALQPEGAPFPDLKVTVSQTKDLVSQGIKVSWTGGKKSEQPNVTDAGANLLQIAQCWGEDPNNPGHPDRRTCQYGSKGAGAARDGARETNSVAAAEDQRYTGLNARGETYTAIPFVAVNAERIVDDAKAPADRVLTNLTKDGAGNVVEKPDAEIVNLATNQFFTAFTSNEIRWAGAGADGSGSVPFEVQTSTQSTALGCGAPISKPDGSVAGQSCWLVVIPRGQGDSDSTVINKPGLWWDAWEHHVAVKLDFKPLGVRCQIGAAERQLAGSELVAGAIGSWQPELCKGENGSPFVLNQSNEADAVARAAGTDPSPLAFTSRPLDVERIGGGSDPVTYAPVAVAGIAVSFAIDRQPHPQNASSEEKSRRALPMTDLKLTPRLMAKLLTASYVESLPDRADKSHIGYKSFNDPGKNPRTLLQDPEFLAINDPEWSSQLIVGPSVADVLAPLGRSDVAYHLWEYVLSDPAARAWLAGEPDENGMIVNPWYSTDEKVNKAGVELQLPADSFPKADPIEKPAFEGTPFSSPEGPINLVTWRPFTNSFLDGAYQVLRGDGKTLTDWEPTPPPGKWNKRPPSLFGSQSVLGLTSTPAAALYQTVVASLRNPAGEFVAPTRDSLAAGTAAMTPADSQPAVMTYDPSADRAKAAPNAYPLTMPVYAALNPRQSDAELRAVYADLIRFAAKDGQQPGTDLGNLPPGYAPLPQSWAEQALAAADTIERGGPPPAATQPPTAPPSTDSPVTVNPKTASVPPVGGSRGSPPAAGAAPLSQELPPATPIEPTATGEGAGPLAGAVTADDPEIGPSAAAVPIGLATGLAAALAVPLLTRTRRPL